MTPVVDDSLLDPDRAEPRADAAATDYFTFALCRRVYALPPAAVELVVAPHEIVAVPGAPAYVLGVVHLRGRILTAIDLAAVLAIDRAADAEPAGRLVIVHARDFAFAVPVDATLGLWPVAASDRRASDGRYVTTMLATTSGAAAALLDVAALLDGMLAGART